MGLRDANPFIEQDLNLIISTFEKKMIRSRDADSVFVGFRRDIEVLSNVPVSVITAAEMVPSVRNNSSDTTVPEDGESPPIEYHQSAETVRTPSPEEVVDDPTSGEEDSEEEEWRDKLEKWGKDCQPCDFREMFEASVDFDKDISAGWEDLLGKIEKNLPDLENLMDLADIDLAEKLCDLAMSFKGQCSPDLEKVAFLLEQFLNQGEIEMSVDLGIFDSLITSILEPLFNELMASLDIIDTLLLGPVQCVIDEIQRQIEELPRRGAQPAQAFQRAMTGNLPEGMSTSAQATAERMRQEQQEREQELQRRQQRPERVMGQVSDVVDRLEQAASLEIFDQYLERAFNWLREKKDWLLQQLQDLVDEGTDRFSERIDFARGKTNILQFLSIINAIIQLAENGDISCGPGNETVTEEELSLIANVLLHPSAPSDISEEDGMIVVRRREVPGTSREDGIRPEATGTIRAGAEGEDAVSEAVENIVVRRPISSCLKKVTQDEADQVSHWIRQLEEEG